MRTFILALTAILAAGTAPAADLRFVDETADAGISHTYTGGFQHFVGGGVAAFDCDQDHLPDLYLAGGALPAALYRNVSRPGVDPRFAPAGTAATRLTGVTGAYPLDADGDGLVDIFVMRAGENIWLRGVGDCAFERANEAWGYAGGADWTTAFAAHWFDDDAFPTIAVGNYTQPDANGGTFGVCQANQLIRPAGAAGFAAPKPLEPSYCALSMLFTSWRGNGAPDLRISNDRQYYPAGGAEQLWRIGPDTARAYGVADGWQPLRIWGMAIAHHDVTGDGRPDYYLTSMADNKLRALDPAAGPAPTYADNAFAYGVTAHRPSVGDTTRPSTSWHAEFADVDNDGDADLFVAKGNVEAMAEFAMADPNALLLRDGDVFTDAAPAAGLASPHRGRGAAVVDLNADGALDVVVVNRNAPAQVWRNAGVPGNWLALALRQDAANAHGVGAWVEVKTAAATTRRQVTVGGGHAGGQHGWLHFGVGDASSATVTVTWSDGATSTWQIVTNQHLRLVRGNPHAVVVEPGVI